MGKAERADLPLCVVIPRAQLLHRVHAEVGVGLEEAEEDLEEGGGRRGLEECLAILQLDEGLVCWCWGGELYFLKATGVDRLSEGGNACLAPTLGDLDRYHAEALRAHPTVPM